MTLPNDASERPQLYKMNFSVCLLFFIFTSNVSPKIIIENDFYFI